MQHTRDDALATAILQTVRLPLLALDADLRVEAVNDAFLQQFRVAHEDTVGQLVYELGNGQWNIPELRRLLSDILPRQSTVSGYRVIHDFEHIGRRIMHVDARRIARSDGPDLILLALNDDTEREALRAELHGRIELADKLIDSVREGLLILDPDLRVHSASGSFYEIFGVDPAETVGRLVYELGNRQWDIPELRLLLEDILPRQRAFDDFEVRSSFDDIGERVMLLNGRRLDHMDLIVLAIRDVTEFRESAARFDEVTKAAHIGVFEADLRAGRLFWSPELREIVGYPRDRPTPPPTAVPDFIHPEDKAAVAEMFKSVLDPKGDGVIMHEHRIVHPGGATRWIQMHGRSEFAGLGGQRAAIRVRGVLLDVTDRKSAEEQLRTTQERQRFLFELSDALRATADPRDITSVATRLLGTRLNATRAYYVIWPVGEDYGEVFPDYAVPGLSSLVGRYPIAAFRSTYDRLARGACWIVTDAASATEIEEAERDTFVGLGLGAWVDIPLVKDGKLKAALCVVQSEPRVWTAEEVALIEGFSERTWAAVERSRAEAALRESEKRLAAVMAYAPVGIGLFDRQGSWVFTNPVLDRYIGDRIPSQDPDQLDRWHAVDQAGEPVPPQSWPGARALRGEVVSPGVDFRTSIDGTDRWVSVSAAPVSDGDVVQHAVVILEDITERKRNEERIHTLMREVNHRSKNLLALMQSIARQTASTGVADFLERFDERVSSLAAAQDLLVRHWREVPLEDLVLSQIAHFADLVGTRIAISGRPLSLTPSASQLIGMALHELATNAAKYGALSTGSGCVTITWDIEGDAGEPHVTLAWVEAGGPPVSVPNRLGFGSSVTTQMLEFGLGGEVSTTYARDGLRWHLRCPADTILASGSLPIVSRSLVNAAANSNDFPKKRGRRVLVVEDEPLMAAEIASILREAGCEVVGPTGGVQQALALLREHACDIAVLDVHLRGETSEPIAAALLASDTPFLVVSGYSREQLPKVFQGAPLIGKPLRKAELGGHVERCLSGDSA
jgi:PAS domain S-box-containing protein